METKINRVGDLLMVVIPEELVARAGFEIGEALEWTSGGYGQITLRRPAAMAANRTRDRITLEELLEGVPDGGVGGEYDWGPPQGVEFW